MAAGYQNWDKNLGFYNWRQSYCRYTGSGVKFPVFVFLCLNTQERPRHPCHPIKYFFLCLLNVVSSNRIFAVFLANTNAKQLSVIPHENCDWEMQEGEKLYRAIWEQMWLHPFILTSPLPHKLFSFWYIYINHGADLICPSVIL